MVVAACEDLADILFRNTSDGQKQRVLLARAICQEPMNSIHLNHKGDCRAA